MTADAPVVWPLVGLLVAYVMGSFPSAYLAGKSRGIDLRQHGSGNLGATNVVRVLGAKIGAVVFIVDILKGFLPVFFVPRLIDTPHPELFALALGVAAILGHVKPVFLLGKGGGKGVATAAGVFLGLAWLPATIACAVWLIVFLVWRYVSLASLAAAAALPIAFLATGWAPSNVLFWMSVVVAVFVFYTHRANIGRLRRGEEHNFRRKRTPPASGSSSSSRTAS
jgi:glycerol-3-phosphate acyltransferase PlsY